MHEAVAAPAADRLVYTYEGGEAVFEVPARASRPEPDPLGPGPRPRGPGPRPRGPGNEYYVVRKTVREIVELTREAGVVASIVERTNVGAHRVLRHEALDEADIDNGLAAGLFEYLGRAELLDRIDPAKCGVGISGGGDCAGIADFIATLAAELNDGTNLLGVRNAGKGYLKVRKVFERL